MEDGPKDTKRRKIDSNIISSINTRVYVQELLQDNDAIIHSIRGLQNEVGHTDSIYAQTQVLARNLEMIIRIADIQNLLTGEDHKKTQPVHDTSNANTQRKNKPSLMRALRSVGVRPFKDFKIKPL